MDRQLQRYTAVICGSFRKHFSAICQISRLFEENGIRVLSPKISPIVSDDQGFAVLELDENKSPKEIEETHLKAIRGGDFIYFYNPEGYMGASAAMELGYALALNKPLFFKEKPADFTHALFSEQILSPVELAEKIGSLLRKPTARRKKQPHPEPL